MHPLGGREVDGAAARSGGVRPPPRGGLAVRAVALLLAAVAPAIAGAGDATPAGPDGDIQDPRAPRFADVERGLFVGFEAGWLGLLRTPTADRSRFPYAGAGGGAAGGLLSGIHLGVDLGTRVSLSAFLLDGNEKASASYGAFDLVAVGGDIRWAFLAVPDANGWERLFVYVHARGGALFTHPVGLFGSRDALLGGGVGVEYHTLLRHFSIGLQLDGLYVLEAKAAGIAATPFVRYTF